MIINQLIRRFSIVMVSSLILLLISSGCAPKFIEPLSLSSLPSDKEQVAVPPTEEELINKPSVLLPLIVFKDLMVTDIRQETILNTVHEAFKIYGNFSIISGEQVQSILTDKRYRKLQISNVADAIHIGSENNANYVSQVQISIMESQLLESKDAFKANITLAVFKTDTGQVAFKTDVAFDSQKPDNAKKMLKELVQTYFRLRGFILETRGGRQVARISVGKGLGIEMGREFEVKERTVRTELIEDIARKKVSYQPGSIATAKVVKVSEDEAWLAIKKEDQAKIKIGQVVFSLPEKSSFFDRGK